MSVDIVSLVYAADTTQLDQAEKAFQRVTAAVERHDAVERRRATSTGQAAAVTSRAAQSSAGYANSLGAVERANMGAAKSAAAIDREMARAARTAETYARRVDTIEKALSPAAAVSVTLAQRTAALDRALATGGISAERHARVLGQVTAAAKAGEAQLARTAKATGLAAHELTNLGYQAQDVFVSLASGQNPFLVLAQQGSQVAQVLGSSKGGFGGGLKELGSIAVSVLGKAGPIAAGVGVLALLATAFLKGSADAAAFQNTMTATGNYAGLTAGSYEDMAKRVAAATDTSVRSAKAGISELAATGRFSAKTIELAVDAAQRYSRLTGESASDILKDYASMADGVTKWAARHTLAYHDLSLAQLDRIAALEKAGKSEEAYQLALSGIDEAVKNRAEPAYGFLQELLHDTAVAASNMWDQILGIGRPDTLEGQIAKVQSKLKSYDTPYNRRAAGGDLNNAPGYGGLQLNLGILQMQKAGIDKAAADAAKKAQDEADKINKKYGSGAGSKPKAAKFDNSEAAVEQATRAELQARQALTRNVEEVAAFKLKEIASELVIQQQRVARGVHDGSITKASAEIANAKYAEAAAAQRELARREEMAGIVAKDLDAQRALNGYAERIATAQVELAGSASDQNALASARLARQQAFERQEQAYQDGLLVLYGQITQAEYDRRAAALRAAQFGEALVQAEQNRVRSIHEAAQSEQAVLGNQAQVLEAQASLTTSTYARSVLGQKILEIEQKNALSKAQEAVDVARIGSAERQRAERALATLRATQGIERQLIARETRLVNAIGEAADGVRGFKSAIRRHDWAGIFDEFQRTIEAVRASFARNGLSGGLITAGSAAATLIGGKSGRAIGTGLGLAGLGASAGAYLGSAAGAAAAGGLGGLLGGGALGAGIANGLVGLAPVLGPLALAAGALYAAAKIFNVGGKPTNAGAGYDLRTGAVTGDKRTSETEGAATSAGQAIQGIMDALKEAGVGVKDAVTGLVIGTRDASQIYLASGKTLTSAVGDSAAAVDTALKALLEGATYASDAQKKVVEAALATGKGFDAVSEALANYGAAQAISGSLADQILQLTKPQEYDTQAVKRDIQAQRDAAKAAADAGYLTADQLSAVNTQLATLEGLRLDEVLKRYADGAASAANDNQTFTSVTQAAKSAVLDAYDTFASTKQAEVEQLRRTADGLRAFRRELDVGAVASRDPVSQYVATKREFDRISALGANDPDRLANLQTVSQAFLEASRTVSPTELAFDRDLQAVRRAVEASQTAANDQADLAQLQLDTATAQLTALGLLNATTADLAQALKNYLAAQAAEKKATGAVNDNIDVARYVADNPDLSRNWMAGGSLRGLGATLEEAALAHYRMAGKAEIAAGTRRFATGGSMDVVGPSSGDRVPVNLMANGGETVSVSRSDNMERVARALERQNELLAEQNRLLGKSNVNTGRTAAILTNVTPDGDALKVAA